MRVVVLGAGVVGVTTAYYLAEAGHEVVLVDRQPAPALETSYANAGEISPGYASPWAAPGIPMKAVRWLFMRHAPLVIKPRWDGAMLAWMAAMLRNCTASRYALNKSHMVRLAEYSRSELIALRQKLALDYDQRSLGTIQLFRTQKQLDASAKDIAVLDSYGIDYEVLDTAGCLRHEPGLGGSQERIAGGLRLPRDETGDCHIFSNLIAARLEAMGVELRYNSRIDALEHDGGQVTRIRTDRGAIGGDAFVVALASHSAGILARLGIRLPVYPVKGYSITLPISEDSRAPVSTILDETYKVAITRLGTRIRVGGMAEISGFDRRLPPRREQTLRKSLGDLFPGAAAEDAPSQFWSGLRPMTPDSVPVVGATAISNLFLNTGHGTLGWTMACGSGRLVADIISRQPHSIDPAGLGIERYLT